MTHYTATPIALVPIEWDKIPEAIRALAPDMAGPLTSRVVRLGGTEIHIWQRIVQDGWVNIGPPLLLTRTIGKVKPACTHCGRVGHTRVNCPELRAK